MARPGTTEEFDYYLSIIYIGHTVQ